MQKILRFEITMAIKDRPRFFQLITLALFSFSLTVIVIGSFTRLSADNKPKQVYKATAETNYIGFASSTSYKSTGIKK